MRWADDLEASVLAAIQTLRRMSTDTFDGEPLARPLELALAWRPDRKERP
jgi:hypothetical protein